MKEETKTNVKRMNRLGLLYCTLMKGQYMSSIALELEFLFRLLAISTTTTTTSVLFESSHDCIEFSKQVLNSKEVQSLLSSFGPHFHHPLSHYHENYNLFQLPSSLATTTLKNKIKSTEMKMMIHVEESCANQYSLSVLLTRPFQHTRDSRHAYAKSQELMKQYQNREECRDAFVYQLRYFQDTYFEQHPPQKQHAYKNIFQKLHPSNQPWFANFTCDLLLQIGLLPLEETDQDVLHHIGNDKERLQKLHQRFTSKNTTTTASSKTTSNTSKKSTLNDDSKNISFVGFEEFFHQFLQAVDSYQFHMLLQQELIQALQKELFKQQQQQNNNQYYEKQLLPTIAQTQLIAKFLGYFTFHWNHTTKTTTLLQPPIPIMEYIQTAWETKNHLIIMIPWILEFLKMMMNNNPSATKTKISSSSLSPYYQKVLGYLRSIQLSLAQSIYDDHTTLNEDYPKCTSFVTVLYLEGFFSKIIGLEEIQQLSSSTLPPRSSNSLKSGLDQCHLYFPKSFLCATFPHLNTLYKMLLRKPSPTSIHHQSGEKLKTTTPRKLKPYSISTIPTSSTTNTNILFSPIITSKESHNKDEIFRMKLVDSFFHQHPQLKHICDFVVDLSIKAITSDVLPNRITPAIKSEVAATQNKTNENKNGYDNGIVSMAKNDSDWNSHGDQSQGVMKENEMNINSKTQKILHDYLEMYISQSMRGLLTMTHMDEKVKQVFTNITLQIAKQKGIKLVSSFVRTELVKRYEESSSIQNNNATNCRQKKKVSIS